ncbi:FHA domain-containing protein [Deinococcus arenicola]|uniref:FHA domain-containing protein n=1 Tax=Deinococcus arenicola TaxID=2994950 RepID=A0ABU4DUU7_9DEIO|nr:FHA domain-containing protein [Deinococcus sp. ZS9-10]MDV6376212.1 FHA domain-containing protein [Deinococcus sp. ZS9-10]
MTILCQVCGTPNLEGTTYCEGCGVELSSAAVSPSTAMPEIPLEENVLQETPSQEVPSQIVSTGAEDLAVFSPAEEVPQAEPTLPSAESSAETAPPTEAEVEDAAPTEIASVETASEESESETPAPDAPLAAPALTGEAKLGIKKFGAPTGEFIPLQGERLVVGRFDASSGPVDIDLSGLGGQEHISRRHAELYREQGGWAVRDLGSTNGVYIKRKGESGFSPRLQEPALLADGDEVAFGNLMLTFHQG